jgi:hypothetical protein
MQRLLSFSTSVLLVTLVFSGCISTQETLLGEKRAPTSEDAVQVYRSEAQVTCAYEEVALIHAQGSADFTNEAQMIRRGRKDAAKLGANGLILTPIDEPSVLGRAASVAVGTTADRRGQMVAIYVYQPCQPLDGR